MRVCTWPGLVRAGVVAGAVLAAIAPSAAGADDGDEEIEYVVRKGDSCESIARRELGDPAAEVTLHLYNPHLGPEPHELKPGMVLKLPRQAPAPAPPPSVDSGVIAVSRRQGPVGVRSPEQDSWEPARRGLELQRGWRVDVPEGASSVAARIAAGWGASPPSASSVARCGRARRVAPGRS